MKVLSVLILLMHIGLLCAHTQAVYNKESNSLEFVSDLEVLNQNSSLGSSSFTKLFTPVAPYNTLTCIITAPKKICVGQPFTIDYTLKVSRYTYVSFWADLLPDFSQMENQGMKLLRINAPTLGIFDQEADSILHRGGKGIWKFPEGIPAGNYHLSFVMIAKKDGLKSFTSILATNPPSHIKSLDLIASNECPVAEPDSAQGYSAQPLIIPVLDNDHAASSLCIKSVQQPLYGNVLIAEDGTLVYTSIPDFEGADHFMYTIQDEAGKTAQGRVDVIILPAPQPQIAL